MALSRPGAYFFITVGCGMLVLAASTVICASIALAKLIGISPVEGSVGFIGLYFIAPGVLCILSGYKQGRAVLGAALATNIMGTVVANSGLIMYAIFWAIRDSNYCDDDYFGNGDNYDYDDYHYHYRHDDDLSCSDLNAVRALHGTNTIVFAILLIISFVGSIYGCVSTCCSSPQAQDYYTLVSTSEPVQTNMMVMTTNQSIQQPTQGFQPPPYVHQDTSININHASNNGNELVNV